MRLYWIKAQAPQRVLALVKHLRRDYPRLDVETIEVDMLGGGLASVEYTALNPNRKAPTLVDGDQVIWEASAIMAYLCNRVGSDLWPAHNPAEQVEVLRWLSWNDTHWAPIVAHFYFEHIVKTTFALGPPNTQALAAPGLLADLHRYATVLDAHMNGRDHPACNRLTIADFQMASMAMYWRESEMPIAQYRNIVRWLDGLARIPAWADPWPDASSQP